MFTAKPDFAHSSGAGEEASDGFKIALGVSAPRFMKGEDWDSGISDMLSSRSGERGGRGRW